MRLRTLFAWHLASSVLFLLGTTIPAVSYAVFRFLLQNPAQLASLFQLLEGIAWVLLTFHVLPEIVVDMNTFPGRSRRVAHIRYGPTPWANLGQSLVFAAACFFQGSYYVNEWYEEEGHQQEKDGALIVLNLIAGHFWLLSGILAATSLGFRCGCCGTSQRLGSGEQFLNDVYILTTFLLCFTAYLGAFAPELAEDFLKKVNVEDSLDYLIHFAIRCIWAFMSFAYVTGDILTMANARNRKTTDGQDSPLGVKSRHGEYA